MNATATRATLTLRCELDDLTARDLMNPDPAFLRAEATEDDAVRLLADRGITAAVVIDDAGRPLGVLTATDMLIHQRERLNKPHTPPTRVSEMMTPAIFSVRLDTPAQQLIEQMVALNVHRLFVVDETDVVVGVVSALGVLRGMV